MNSASGKSGKLELTFLHGKQYAGNQIDLEAFHI
jgi:hypothetical protein